MGIFVRLGTYAEGSYSLKILPD